MRVLAWLWGLLLLLGQTHFCEARLVHLEGHDCSTCVEICDGADCAHLHGFDEDDKEDQGCCEVVSCHDHSAPEGAILSIPESELLLSVLIPSLLWTDSMESWSSRWLPLRGSPPTGPPGCPSSRAPPSAVLFN